MDAATTEQPVTKDYLDVKLAEVRLEIEKLRLDARLAELELKVQEKLDAQFKWNVGLIFGVYAMIAIGYFIK